MDDFAQVVLNKNVHDLSKWINHFSSSTMYSEQNTVVGIYYKPVMMICYSLLWNINNGDPMPFRIFQLFAHIMNSFLIFKLLQNFMDAKQRFLLPMICSLLFLVHPINSEAVLFIADLQEPLYTFFGLLLLITIQKYQGWRGASLFAFFGMLSLLSKESGILYLVTGIFFVFLYKKNQLKNYVVSFASVASVYLFLRFYMAELMSIRSQDMKIATVDTLTRLTSIPKILFHYLVLYVFPKDIALTQDWVVAHISFAEFGLPLFIVIALVGFIFYNLMKLKDKDLLFFSFWFFLGWGLHSQLVPLDGTVSDRWFYFTIVGLTAVLLKIFSRRNLKFNLISKFLLVVLMIAFSIRSYYRSLDWQSPILLFSADLKVDPTSFYLNNNLGQALIEIGKPAEAIPLFKIAIANLNPGAVSWYSAMTNLAASYYYTKDFNQALEILNQIISGNEIKTIRLMILTQFALQDVVKAKQYIDAGLRIYPDDPMLLRYKDATSKM